MNSTLIEAYAAEPSRGQLERVEQAFHDAGARVGLRIMASHGGTISVRAKELARTLVSGPIGGVVGARHLAREFRIENVVCSDIGGTSFDLALIIGGETPIRPTPDIGRYLLNLPMVEIESIGAGTGSFVRIDPSSNRPEIGPDSAGARIGVSWRDGGLETVSVTDLDLVLGRLNPDYFLGGQVELDVEYARHAVERQLARPLGLDVEEAAGGIVDLFEESLRYAALARVLGKGYAPVDFSLFCYGGGGPLHVAGYTRDAGYADVLVPTWAAGFSAFGCACADYEYRYDMTTSIPVVTDAAGAELREAERRLAADWVDLRGRVRSEFAKSGVDDGAVEYRFLVRMQYSGQLNDIEIAAPDGDGTPNVLALVTAFEETYGKIYAHGARSPELGYVITAAIVTGSTPIEKPVLPVEDEVAVPPLPKLSRPVWWSTELGRLETPVFEQDDLRAGHCVAGPAIIESPASTFVVPPGRAATLDRTRIFHLDTEALA